MSDEIKTIDDVEETLSTEVVETEEEQPINEYEELNKELNEKLTSLQEKYNKALEENNKLFRRLTTNTTHIATGGSIDKIIDTLI